MSFFREKVSRKITLAYLTLFALVFIATGAYVSISLDKRIHSELKESLNIRLNLLENIITPALVKQGDRSKIHALTGKLGRDSQSLITVIDAE